MSEIKMSFAQRVVLSLGMILTIILIAERVQWAGRASAQTVPEATIGPAIAAAATGTATPVPAAAAAGTPTICIVGACGLLLAILALILFLRRKKKEEEGQ